MSGTKHIIRVIDLETGEDPIEGDPGIIEYGHQDLKAKQVDMLGEPYDWQVWEKSHFSSYVKMNRPITPDTAAVHNIIDDDIFYAPTWSDVSRYVMHCADPSMKIVALAAHNIAMESTLIDINITGRVPWICTYRAALHLWPDAPSHSNGAIRYYLNLPDLDRKTASPSHRAYPDAYVTSFILREALNAGHSVEQLLKWTIEPALLSRLKIGKDYYNNGKGTPWKDVETSMLEWIVNPLRENLNADAVYTAQYHLDRRRAAARVEREQRDLDKQFVQNGMKPPVREEEKPAAPTPNTLELDL